jgi:hypothetical protein
MHIAVMGCQFAVQDVLGGKKDLFLRCIGSLTIELLSSLEFLNKTVPKGI